MQQVPNQNVCYSAYKPLGSEVEVLPHMNYLGMCGTKSEMVWFPSSNMI